jgi:hypothetical protein
MELNAVNIIARVLIVYGLLVSAFLLSNMAEIKELADVREYASSIFATNCSFICRLYNDVVNSAETCAQIATLLLVLPIVSAILMALFYRAFTMVFTSMSKI